MKCQWISCIIIPFEKKKLRQFTLNKSSEHVLLVYNNIITRLKTILVYKNIKTCFLKISNFFYWHSIGGFLVSMTAVFITSHVVSQQYYYYYYYTKITVIIW